MHPRVRYLIPLLGLGLSSMLLVAQEGTTSRPQSWQAEFKVRTGNAGGVTKDHLSPSTWGLGIGVTHAIGVGRIGIELGYFYKGGDPYLRPIAPVSPGYLGNPQAAPGMESTVTRRNEPLLAPDVLRSIDKRAATSSGLAVRLSWLQPISDTPYSWNAGIMLGGSTYRFNYEGDITSSGWNTSPRGTDRNVGNTDARMWRDTYHGSKADWYKGISPFLGIGLETTKKSFLELNIMIYNYRAIDYIHLDGSGVYTAQKEDWYDRYLRTYVCIDNHFVKDYYTSTTRWMPHLELNYGFRF